MPHKNNTKIHTHASCGPVYRLEQLEKAYFCRPHTQGRSEAGTAPIRTDKAEESDFSEPPEDYRPSLLLSPSGLSKSTPSCNSEASFSHSESHPDLHGHVLKAPETGSDLENDFQSNLVMSCVTQITAGCVIVMYSPSDTESSANIALGCADCLSGPFKVQLLHILPRIRNIDFDLIIIDKWRNPSARDILLEDNLSKKVYTQKVP